MDEIKIEKLDRAEVNKRGIGSWDVWEKEPSEFDWFYTQEEHCFIIEGNARIQTEKGSVEIREGDYVVFPRGLICRWEVVDRLKKHYSFK